MSITHLGAQILERARKKEVVLTCAESCTGGMIAVALTDVPGASDMFHRGFVTYSNAAKIKMLAVNVETLAAFGAVSEQVVAQMAQGARRAAGADLSIATSGVAGPGPGGNKPEGRVCFALSSRAGCHSETVEFGALGRARVRCAARDHALSMIYAALA